MVPDILFEDNHVIVVNKPAGLLTQGGMKGYPSLLDNLKQYIKERDSKPGNVFLGMIHRLDRPVSGVIVFAKTSKAASRLSECIRKRTVLKLYCAVTPAVKEKTGLLQDGWLTRQDFLLREHDTTVVGKQGDDGAQQAVLQFKTLFSDGNHGVHLIRLVTGRKHQIRAQLSHLGLPISGDLKYGSEEACSGDGIGLHALFFLANHPVKKEALRILSLPPARMLGCFTDGQRTAIKSLLDMECRSVSDRFSSNL